MTVEVKFFANLRDGREKQQLLEISEGSTIAHIIRHFSIPEAEVAIIFLNGKRREADESLQHGDVVSLFPPVGGG